MEPGRYKGAEDAEIVVPKIADQPNEIPPKKALIGSCGNLVNTRIPPTRRYGIQLLTEVRIPRSFWV